MNKGWKSRDEREGHRQRKKKAEVWKGETEKWQSDKAQKRWTDKQVQTYKDYLNKKVV